MHPLVERNRHAVEELCRHLRVQRLDLFGSAARADFDPRSSDLDFLVEFHGMAPAEYAEAYFSLLEGLEQLFGYPVDLVTEAAITNPYFLESIERTRTPLYAA